MSRKKRTKKKAEPQTYFQAKNKRWYKKIVVDGKTRCRFVSTAEATGVVTTKNKPATKPKPATASRANQAKPTGTSSPPTPTSQPKAPPTRKSRRKRNDEEKDAPSLNDE